MKSTRYSFGISFVTGAPGAGKSYLMAREVVERLAEHRAPIVTNLPLNVNAIAEECKERFGRDPDEVIQQIQILDRDTLGVWQDGHHGPWSFATAGKLPGEMQGADFILDEVHRFCPKRQRGRQAAWENWLGEVRHEGWSRLVFITQDEAKVGPAIAMHSDARFELTATEREREPFFGSRLIFWYEAIASFTGLWVSRVRMMEFRRGKAGKLLQEGSEVFPLEAEGFKRYQSHAAAGGGTRDGAAKMRREHEKRPKFWWKRIVEDQPLVAPTWAWAAWNIIPPALPRLGILCFAVWLFFGGGLNAGIQAFLTTGQTAALVNGVGEESFEAVPPTEGSAVEGEREGPPEEEEVVDTAEARRETFREGVKAVYEAVATLPEEQRQAVRFLLEDANQVVERQELQIATLQEELREANVIDSVLQGIVKGGAVLSDAGMVRIGQEACCGDLQGRKLVGVSRKNRTVEFDGGFVLHLGRRMREPENDVENGSGQPVRGASVTPTPAGSQRGPDVSERVPVSSAGEPREERSILIGGPRESFGGGPPLVGGR